jgi:PIN domain nuclease of toxin-antitoxin system
VQPFGETDALETAALWAVTRSAGLSLADRACLALARRSDLPAVTADQAWSKVDVGATVTLIR